MFLVFLILGVLYFYNERLLKVSCRWFSVRWRITLFWRALCLFPSWFFAFLPLYNWQSSSEFVSTEYCNYSVPLTFLCTESHEGNQGLAILPTKSLFFNYKRILVSVSFVGPLIPLVKMCFQFCSWKQRWNIEQNWGILYLSRKTE